MKTIHIRLLLFLGISIILFSCEKDNPQKLEEKESTLVQQANKMITGDTLVLSTKATMGSVDKTLLPEGCPTKFHFKWNEKNEKLEVYLPKFSVGTMPFAVYFYCQATYKELNSWEKKDYPEDGWIKFYANNGQVTYADVTNGERPEPDGAGIIEGYVNPKTQEIEFIVNYNVMTVITHTFRQKIDKTRIKRYKVEFEKFEKDLQKYKEEHGL